MENFLKSKQERVDNLHIPEYRLIQNTEHFRYGMDAVLLSWYACQKGHENMEVIDYGTGTGILPILLLANKKFKQIDALEIQEYYVDLAKRNMELNGLSSYVRILHGDIRSLPKEILKGKYDMAISNPPYMSGSIPSSNLPQAIARHEITWSMEDLMSAAKRMLKDKGKLVLIHRAQRLVDVFYFMRLNSIEPKSMRLITPKKSKDANLVLVEGQKNGRPQLTVEKPIVVYKENGEYTQELKAIYGEEIQHTE